METIRFICRHCGHGLAAEEALIGRPVRCERCEGVTRCPGLAGAVELTESQRARLADVRSHLTTFTATGLAAAALILATIALALAVDQREGVNPLIASSVSLAPGLVIAGAALYLIVSGVRFRNLSRGDGGLVFLWFVVFPPVGLIMTLAGYLQARRGLRNLGLW